MLTLLSLLIICIQSFSEYTPPKSADQSKCEYGTCKRRIMGRNPDGRDSYVCGKCLSKVGEKIMCTNPAHQKGGG